MGREGLFTTSFFVVRLSYRIHIRILVACDGSGRGDGEEYVVALMRFGRWNEFHGFSLLLFSFPFLVRFRVAFVSVFAWKYVHLMVRTVQFLS